MARATADERGSVLLSLLLVMCLTALTFSSSLVGTVEYALASNSLRQAQALALAESGIEHSMLVITEADADLASLLAGADENPGSADDGLLIGASAIPLGDHGATYTAVLVDNDDGDGNLAVDSDGVYHLLATGTVHGVSQTVRVVLDTGAGVGWSPPHGILTDDDLTIDSGVELIGSSSSAHSNDDVEIDNHRLDGGVWASDDLDIYASSPEIQGEVLDSDAVEDYEKANDNQPKIDIPEIDPADFAVYADYVLADNGKVYRPDGTVEFDTHDGSDMWGNWKYEGDGDWLLDGPSNGDEGSYYVEGSVKVAGSGGSDADPVELSLFTEGSIEFAGDFDLAARYGDALAVTGGDIFVSGESEYRGSFLVREQLKMQGKSTLYGVIVVEDADDEWDLLDRTSEGTHLTDNTTIWPTGTESFPFGTGGGSLTVLEWREEH